MNRLGFALVLAIASVGMARAQDVRITTFKDNSSFVLNGQSFTIDRIQDPDNILTGEFARTSRECPPFCIQPMIVAEGVATVGELEVMDFLETTASDGRGLLIDSRLPDWFASGTIPGAVNVPFMTLEAENRFRDDILVALGAQKTDGGGLDFSGAMELVMFCNGPWCGQSPRAIEALIDAGYPAERLFYYRGGMQAWNQLGLSIMTPSTEG